MGFTDDENEPDVMYHITPVKNIQSILKHGIKATKKKIFVVDDIKTIHAIAVNQVFVMDFILNPNAVVRFGLFKINVAGLKPFINKDIVGEYTAENQFIINKINITTDRLEFLGEFDTDVKQEKQLREERREKYLKEFAPKIEKGEVPNFRKL